MEEKLDSAAGFSPYMRISRLCTGVRAALGTGTTVHLRSRLVLEAGEAVCDPAPWARAWAHVCIQQGGREENRSVLGQLLISISPSMMVKDQTVAVLWVGNGREQMCRSHHVCTHQRCCWWDAPHGCNSIRSDREGGWSCELQLTTDFILCVCQLLLGSCLVGVEKWIFFFFPPP